LKKVGFFSQLHNARMARVNGLYQKVGHIPICRVCKKPIEVLEIRDKGPDPDLPMWMEIYARCHGKEDYAKVEFKTPCHPNDWASAISTGQFFAEGSDDHMLK